MYDACEQTTHLRIGSTVDNKSLQCLGVYFRLWAISGVTTLCQSNQNIQKSRGELRANESRRISSDTPGGEDVINTIITYKTAEADTQRKNKQ